MSKKFCFKQFNSEYVQFFVYTQLNVQTIYFSLFDPKIGLNQVLPFRARGDQGAMAMKGYSAFPKDPTLLKPHHQIA